MEMQKIAVLLKKYRELIVYVICGGLTTGVSFTVQYLAGNVLKGQNFIELRTIASWIVTVIFAFFVNKIFVFQDTTKKKGAENSGKASYNSALQQFITFVIMRLISLGMEVVTISFGVRILGGDELVSKLIAQVLVLVSNYFFSKFIIFKKKR